MKTIRRWNKKTITSLLIIVSSLVVVHIIQAATAAEPGTDSDPLVTQSYVDQKISSISAKDPELSKKVDELTKKVDELTKTVEEQASKNKEMETRIQSAEKYGMFVPVELTEKQKLMAGASTEIIVRSGSVKAISGTGGGLSDITSGKGTDIITNQDVPLNHLLLASRDDGRGIKIVSKKAWVIVKGPYTIE